MSSFFFRQWTGHVVVLHFNITIFFAFHPKSVSKFTEFAFGEIKMSASFSQRMESLTHSSTDWARGHRNKKRSVMWQICIWQITYFYLLFPYGQIK